MSKTVFIYVNGILTRPGKADNWNGRAVTWTHLHTPHKAEKIEYYIGPVSRVLGQKKRSAKLRKTLAYYIGSGWDVVLVGHSNGANVIIRALRELYESDSMLTGSRSLESIKHVHLFAPAARNNFRKNGMNRYKIPTTIHVGASDWALKIASGLGKLVGYGSLGKEGPVEEDYPVTVVRHCGFGHGTWFETSRLPGFLKDITSRVP